MLMLMHIDVSLIDIIFITQQRSQFLLCPIGIHDHTVCRVLHYLKRCPCRGLLFPRIPHCNCWMFLTWIVLVAVILHAPSAACVFSLSSSLMSLHTKEQQTISRSSSKEHIVHLQLLHVSYIGSFICFEISMLLAITL